MVKEAINPNLTVIPAFKTMYGTPKGKKLKVGAYVRVSSNSEDQLKSLALQISEFNTRIRANAEWEFVGVFIDKGISGTSIGGREGFIEMIEAMTKDEVKLILTKSISRFARNQEELLRTIRIFTEYRAGVYFDDLGINTLEQKTELQIAIDASTAQIYSKNVSENQKWSYKERFQKGELKVSTAPYGFLLDDEKQLIVNEEEAKISIMIAEWYESGIGSTTIKNKLNSRGITKRGYQWNERSVLAVVDNEAIIGDRKYQKTITENYRKRINKGESLFYYIEGNHQGLIYDVTFENMQKLRKFRTELYAPKAGIKHPFIGKIKCAKCGARTRRQLRHKGEAYEKNVFICFSHFREASSCPTKSIDELTVKNAYLKFRNKLVIEQDNILRKSLEYYKQINLKTKEYFELNNMLSEITSLKRQKKTLAQQLSRGEVDSVFFVSEESKIQSRKFDLEKKCRLVYEKDNFITETEKLLYYVKSLEYYTEEFDEKEFSILVDHIEYDNSDTITFYLSNGMFFKELKGQIL